MITFILTACNRPDLLEQTLDSFLHPDFTSPVSRWIVHIDGMDAVVCKLMASKYSFFEVIGTPERVGLAASFDRLMAKVKTEYVFTCEDDWQFSHFDGLVQESIVLLAHCPHINHVWCRDATDHQHPLSSIRILMGIPICRVLKNYGSEKWGGFSLNPGLRRTADYHHFFPNGMAAIGDEAACSAHVEAIGYQAVALVNSACKHIGWHRHTENFKH